MNWSEVLTRYPWNNQGASAFCVYQPKLDLVSTNNGLSFHSVKCQVNSKLLTPYPESLEKSRRRRCGGRFGGQFRWDVEDGR